PEPARLCPRRRADGRTPDRRRVGAPRRRRPLASPRGNREAIQSSRTFVQASKEGSIMTTLRLIVAGIALAGALSSSARGADPADGPRASADPSADITDVFAWMSPDAERVNLVMSLVRNASGQSRFSNSVDYVFHTTSRASFGARPSVERDIVCTFNKKQ